MISPERPLLALVPADDLWVVANFKEDQLADMRPGQPVDIEIDTYGRRGFTGHVESLAGASGARFALLPPDNASGNFIKVVQRVPVLIRFDGKADVPLRPGMSADVVRLHPRRAEPGDAMSTPSSDHRVARSDHRRRRCARR